MQGPANSSQRAFAVERVGLLEGMGIDGQGSVELVLIGRNAGQILQHQLAGCDRTPRQRSAHFGNARFDDAERLANRPLGLGIGGAHGKQKHP